MTVVDRRWMRFFLGVDFTWDELRNLGELAERDVETVELEGDWL